MEKGSSSSSSSSAAGGGPDSLNGLKFGKKIYFEGVGSGPQPKTGGAPPPEASLPSSPAKKGRSGFLQGGQPPRCQVEGCRVDLSDAKAYYSRHKVCGMHSKSPMVIVAGIQQRFCQQCSRFHQLPEFDQGKRSCRRRLAGHNERRRKPPAGPLLSPRYGTLCPSIYENPTTARGFVMDFSSYPNPTLLGRNSGFVNHQLPWQSSSQPPLSDLLLGSTPRSGSSSEVCFNGVSGSTNALSLLSNQPWPSKPQSSILGANNLVSTNGTPMAQPSVNLSASVAQFGWGFKDYQGNGTPQDMRPVLGLEQTSGQHSGELGLAQPNEGQLHELDHSRGYDSSTRHMHWSL